MTRRRIAGAVVPVAGIALAAGLAAGGGDEPARAQDAGSGTAAGMASAPVERRTLIDRETVDGTLGHADERTVGTQLRGTLTWLPREGAKVRPGRRLFEVDGDPVVLMDGRVPAYRELAPGAEGEDVRQLEQGLRALGYADALDVDDEYTSATAAAVREWQEDRGLERTGRVELGRVVFLRGTRRIAAVEGDLGAQAGGAVLATTSTRREVAVDLDAADQQLVRRGRTVEVELPDGTTVDGRIASIGTVATPASSGEGEGGGGEDDDGATIPVTIRLPKGARIGRLDEAPVSVGIAREVRRRVLTVPVTALVALRGGSFGVRLAGGRVVRVEPGLSVDGDVEVSGALREGQKVLVPR